MSYLDEQLDIREGEPHYAEVQYIKEHGLSLLDFDCWVHLESLLGFDVLWDDYLTADNAIDCIMLDVQPGSEEHMLILNALDVKHNPKNYQPIVYTVAIKDLENDDGDIWISTFSTEERADKFAANAQRKLDEHGITTVQVCKDAGHIDDDMYLDWLDERYRMKDADND